MTVGQDIAAVSGRVATLGFVAGLRSQMPLAVLALRSIQRGEDSFLGKRGVVVLLCLAAAGEVVGDKLPMTPSRLEPQSLGGRLMMGSFAGSILSRRRGAPVALGVALGAAGALAGSYAGFSVRDSLGRATCIPDVVWAGLEDITAVTLGMLATHGHPPVLAE